MDMLQDHFGRRRRVLASVSWRKGLEVYRSISSDNRDELIFIISNAQLEQLQDVEEVLQRRVQFRSPNLALLSEAGTLPDERGYWICRMELASSFRNIIRENNSNPRKLILFVQQVAMGLVVVHRSSGFHGDIRPSTIFVKHVGGQDKAFSMGMALDLWVNPPDIVELSSREVSRFIPPELTLGEELGPSTDIYSIGVLLYHVVCGGYPFDGDSPRDIVVAHTHGLTVEKPEHIDSDLWSIIEKCLQQSSERRIDIEDLINQLQPFTIGRRAVYINEYMQSQENANSQSRVTDLVNYDNIVRDFPDEDSYSQEQLDFRFPSSIIEHQNSTSLHTTSTEVENIFETIENSDTRKSDNIENNTLDEHHVDFTGTGLIQEKYVEKKYAEKKYVENQENRNYDDETQPLDNTDQITDVDIDIQPLKRDLFGKVLQEDNIQNQQKSVNRSEELNLSDEQRKNVLLSLDPLDADFSEEFSAAEFQLELRTSKQSVQTAQIGSVQNKILDNDIPSEEYSYEWSSEVFDPEMSESEDVTALPLAVFVQPSEKKLEVTDLEAMSEDGMSEDGMSEDQHLYRKEDPMNNAYSGEHQDLDIATENQNMVGHVILQRGYDNQNDNTRKPPQNIGNDPRVNLEMDSDQTMVSEAEEESDFIFDQTLKGINVQPSLRNSENQLNRDSVQQKPIQRIDVQSGREVSLSQSNQRNQSPVLEQRNMGRVNHKSTPRVELESILPLEERRVQEEDISEISSVLPQSTNIRQSLLMFAVGFFALGGLYIFIYSLIIK